MKKIISALIIFTMLCSAFLAAIPAFADVDEAWDELEWVIDDAEDFKERKYTAQTWSVFKAALDAAKAALGAQYPDENSLNEARIALEAAIDDLKEVTLVDLKALIDCAKTFENDGFSAQAWEDLQDALADAEECYEYYVEEDYVDEDELSEYYYELKKALQNMKYDTSALDNLITKAKVLYTNSTYAERFGYVGDYTEQTFEPFVAAYNEAKVNVQSNDYELISKSTKELGDAINALVAVSVPNELKTELAELIDLADVLIPEEWPATAWKMVEMKLGQAMQAWENDKLSAYVKGVIELKQALMNLTNKDKPNNNVLPQRPVVDTSYLDELIKWCEDSLVEKGYSEESWEELSEALKNAKAVSNDPRKAEIVKAAYDRLLKAKNDLEALEGAEAWIALKALVEEIEALDPTEFTSESWADMKTALDAAKAALDLDDQVDVDAVLSALEEAKKNLVRDDKENESKETQQTQQTQEKQTEIINNDQPIIPESSGCTSAIGTTVAVMTAVLGFGAAMLLKRKEN